jgi:DNA polymerase I-like protein with 3'-5' exonuclease and polymerase domains
MHTTGIWVNKLWRDVMLSFTAQAVEEKAAALVALVDHPEFRPTPNSMRSLIYKKHETKKLSRFSLPDPIDKRMYSKKRPENISVNENSLLLLMVSGACSPELTAIIEAWWEYQGEYKRQGYLKSELLDQAIGPDGRLRPGWNSCGTDTGRFSCSAPNVMNIEQLLRHMFGPAPGNVMVHADKSQLELRVMAAVAADNTLQDALNTGDVYSFNAKQMFQLPDDTDVKKTHAGLRKAAKIIHLGRQYGAGLKVILQQALRQDRRFSLARVKTFTNAWDKLYYRTVRYWEEEMGRVMECGYSESRIMGRRRTYPRPPERSEVANYPVQSSAADIMNVEVLKTWRRLKQEVPSARVVIQLHDAIDVECPEREAGRVERIIDEELNSEWTIAGRRAAFPIERKTASFTDTWAAV